MRRYFLALVVVSFCAHLSAMACSALEITPDNPDIWLGYGTIFRITGNVPDNAGGIASYQWSSRVVNEGDCDPAFGDLGTNDNTGFIALSVPGDYTIKCVVTFSGTSACPPQPIPAPVTLTWSISVSPPDSFQIIQGLGVTTDTSPGRVEAVGIDNAEGTWFVFELYVGGLPVGPYMDCFVQERLVNITYLGQAQPDQGWEDSSDAFYLGQTLGGAAAIWDFKVFAPPDPNVDPTWVNWPLNTVFARYTQEIRVQFANSCGDALIDCDLGSVDLILTKLSNTTYKIDVAQ